MHPKAWLCSLKCCKFYLLNSKLPRHRKNLVKVISVVKQSVMWMLSMKQKPWLCSGHRIRYVFCFIFIYCTHSPPWYCFSGKPKIQNEASHQMLDILCAFLKSAPKIILPYFSKRIYVWSTSYLNTWTQRLNIYFFWKRWKEQFSCKCVLLMQIMSK